MYSTDSMVCKVAWYTIVICYLSYQCDPIEDRWLYTVDYIVWPLILSVEKSKYPFSQTDNNFHTIMATKLDVEKHLINFSVGNTKFFTLMD